RRTTSMRIGPSIRHNRLLAVVARRDAALFDLICAHRTLALSRLMVFATRSGDARTYLLIAALGFVVGGPTGAALIGTAAAAGLASAIAYIPKRLIARPRPTRALPLRIALVELPDAWSFPSSHTATAVAAACVFGAAFGPVGLAFALLWAFAVGIS